ncbi:MAG: DNA repair protein RadC [Flavobacteriales bacterium]|nr:DNA repair protein RadC [Flavobacteriales bacterium]
MSKTTPFQLQDSELPREKMIRLGVQAISDRELVAIILGSGNAKHNVLELSELILSDHHHDLSLFARSTPEQLQNTPGIGVAKSLVLTAALELGRRSQLRKSDQKQAITQPEQAYELIRYELMDLSHEEFWIICLNRGNKFIMKTRISSGGIAGTVADPKMIFQKALAVKASGIILVHNHPSGNLKASEADIKITQQLIEAGRVLDCHILDHIIVTDQGYLSFAWSDVMKFSR